MELVSSNLFGINSSDIAWRKDIPVSVHASKVSLSAIKRHKLLLKHIHEIVMKLSPSGYKYNIRKYL